jgi:hypothetical protein
MTAAYADWQTVTPSAMGFAFCASHGFRITAMTGQCAGSGGGNWLPKGASSWDDSRSNSNNVIAEFMVVA